MIIKIPNVHHHVYNHHVQFLLKLLHKKNLVLFLLVMLTSQKCPEETQIYVNAVL